MYYILTKMVNVAGLSYQTEAAVSTNHPGKFLADGWQLHTPTGGHESEAEAWQAFGLKQLIRFKVALARDEAWGN